MSNHFISAVSVFMLAGSVLGCVPAGAQALKGAGTCNDEYKANKAAIKAAKELKKDFILACRALPAGTPTPIGSANPTPGAPPPAPAPQQAPVPAPSQRSQAPAPANVAPGESACGNGYAHLPASHTAVQFCTEQEAKSRCPGAPVVWTNTKTKIYHKAGSNTYGHTKEGAYMCQSDADAEGDRMSKNGH